MPLQLCREADSSKGAKQIGGSADPAGHLLNTVKTLEIITLALQTYVKIQRTLKEAQSTALPKVKTDGGNDGRPKTDQSQFLTTAGKAVTGGENEFGFS